MAEMKFDIKKVIDGAIKEFKHQGYNVSKWISVDEALPIYDGLVLICYNDKRIRLGVYTEDGWYSDEGNPIMEQPDFWVRIPEPPKDGDTND